MTEPKQLITDMGRKARAAFSMLTGVSDAQKSAALKAAARHLRDNLRAILAANQRDMENARDRDLIDSMLDRLMIDAERLEAIAAAVEHVAELPDPVGQVIDSTERPNGLLMERIRVPLGVIGIISESRPNVP
ncbi:MAG: gamma-glutamyl-phosphate reductase, partial [Sphingomonadales bacterium]|nr:gamma-glutamyl-phosphate reductase [Sphingomonadales bacterium]